MTTSTVRRGGAFADPRFRRLVWAIVGILGWLGLVALGLSLFAQRPPRAGFDLTLILDAGRRVAAGQTPYVAGSVTTGTQVEDLFYSYPPPVAQIFSFVGWLSNGAALAMFGVLAVIGFGAVVVGLSRQRRLASVHAGATGDPPLAPGATAATAAMAAAAAAAPTAPTAAIDVPGGSALDVLAPALGLAPYVYPFAIALLFGNLDALFPFVYGATLLAVSTRSLGWRMGGGIAIGLVALAKLHPGGLLVWLAVRGLREQRSSTPAARSRSPAAWSRPPGLSPSWVTLAAAVGAIALVVAVSLVAWGTGPWTDYVALLRAGTGAAFSSTLNIGPASQLALVLGDPGAAPRLAPLVSAAALVVTAAVAFAIRSTLLSFAIAAAASLVISPITWFHYPVAMFPVAVAAWVAARGGRTAVPVTLVLVAALVIAAAAIVAPVLVWVAVGLVIVGAAMAPDVGESAPADGRATSLT